MERPYYTLGDMLQLVTVQNYNCFQRILEDHWRAMATAPGSSKNHQAWEGGYHNHITETMNIAMWLYTTSPRPLPFALCDVLEVMFLHDLEKIWKYGYGAEMGKADRKTFRALKIQEYGIKLRPEQENALEYVEGIPDSKYTPGDRVMNEMAAFCHCCDIMSARLWHDKGREGAW